MNLFELLALILENLNRRKARVALTAIGVVIGTAAIVVLVSLAIGLQKSANERLYGIGDLTVVHVYPNYGSFPGGGPGMVMVESGGRGSTESQATLVTDNSLIELAGIPGVQSVIPRDNFYGGAMLKFKRLEGWANIIGLGADDLSVLGLEAEVGTTALAKGTIILGSSIKNNFYDPKMRPGQEPPEPPQLADATIQLVLTKWDQEGGETKKTIPLRVAGILTEKRDEADWSVYMNIDDVTKYNEWVNGRRINRKRDGYSEAVVKIDSADHVLSATEQINALGYQAYTSLEYVQQMNSFFLILQIIFGGVGAIALLVAAIGIANTMAMAILERTREIGLMKAVGATNRDVLSVFLGESAGIGLLGGLGGVLLGWSLGQLINVLGVAYLAGQAAQQGGPPPTSAVTTPAWLLIFALVFATFIGLLSGLYPALRAATMIPVTALKYE